MGNIETRGIDVFSFPLFDLPIDALNIVLQNMNLFQQLGISIISKRSKKLVKSLNLDIQQISVTIHDPVYLTVHPRNSQEFHWQFFTNRNPRNNIASEKEMYTPDSVITLIIQENGGLKSFEWKKPGFFGIKDWIDHFVSVFNRPKLDRLSFVFNKKLDVECIHKTINDVAEIDMNGIYTATYIQQVVQTYSSAKRLKFVFGNVHNFEDFHNIFCQSWDVVTLKRQLRNALQKCELNDLLVMNSRSINVLFPILSQEDVNKFLKHWINGSNPRMKHIVIEVWVTIAQIEEVILKGLDYQIVPPDQERLFENFTQDLNGSRTVVVKGGYDIWRKDGTTATITYKGRPNYYSPIEIFVWH